MRTRSHCKGSPMPRWRKLCIDGEEPSRSIVGKEFEDIFGVRTWKYPDQLKEGEDNGFCFSHVPEEWVPAVLELVKRIHTKFTPAQIRIDQIKDKFGMLRVYYTVARGEFLDTTTVRDLIDVWVKQCEEKLKKADPHYGTPY